MSASIGTANPSTSGTVTTTSNAKQLSDGNALTGGPGVQLGFSASDKLAAYGGTPAVQSSSPVNSTTTRGMASGVVMTFASAQSPSAVTTLTSSEKSVTVQNGTGSVLTPKSTDMIIVNKPTAQAGLGVGNARYSSAGVIGLTFTNFSAGTLTPTASEAYGIVVARGVATVTTVLTPAAVTASTTAEQTFTVSGMRVGLAVAVNKPTSQAGLDIAGVRASANNQVAITFVNVTAGTLTPTAAETYTFFASSGIEASTNTVMLAANQTLTPATVATITTADVTLTSANVLVDDTVIGVQKPTLQAGLGIVASRVSAANALKITYVNPTAGTLTPTASEVLVVSMFREAPAAPCVIYSATLTPSSVAANTTAEQTFTVTGVVSGSAVIVNKPTQQAGLGIMGARVSTTNVVAITFCNATATAITPTAAEVYTVANFQALIDTTTGNAFVQGGSNVIDSNTRVANAMATALGPTGLNFVGTT